MMIGQLGWEKIDLIRLLYMWRLCYLQHFAFRELLLKLKINVSHAISRYLMTFVKFYCFETD